MRKALLTLMSLVAMLVTGTGLKAQEVTIRLMPGWNWIAYPFPETVSVETAFGDFEPMEGDIIESQFGYSEYLTGYGWFGGIDVIKPGWGYVYYSNRIGIVNLVLGTPVVLPTVTTATPSGITTYGMTCGGEVTDSGNSGVLVRGVCWNTQQNPTINDPHTTDGYGTGSFSSIVEGLEMNTTYYMRAYAMTTSGAGYGEQVMVSTKNGVPVLTTSAASEIGVTWATCGGDISDDGGMEVTERGICWSTDHNPTIAGNHGSNGAGLGSFSVNMNGLEPNTMYYVRAYAINSQTTAYGNEVSFCTEVAQTWPNGKLPGQFSVSATHQVQFSQGNLQYIGSAATPYWRFAEHQYDYLGTNTGQNSSNQNVDRDLFGWGTSGWNNGNMYYQPYDTEQFWDSNAGYGYGPTDGTNYNYGLTGDYANADWGVYNAIINGGNASHQWRTLTYNEWNYLINTRATESGIRYAKAQVYGVNGLVVLPDDWDASLYVLNYSNNTQAPFDGNVIADADWATMETNGAVFLPTAGMRNGISVSYVGYEGNYSSATYNNNNSYGMGFSSNSLNSYYFNNYCYRGFSVRLVSVTLPEVSTAVNYVLGNSAIIGGTITDDGNADVSICGICYSNTLNPTTNDSVVLAQGVTLGEFELQIDDLDPNTTYYVRAFATNSAGTAYGNEVSFSTSSGSTWPNGILPGAFSVSEDLQIQFSQGNLQYIGSASTPYWKFAEYQWNYLGTTTGQDSDSENVDRDLFGWGTSGYNHGAVCYHPWSTSTSYSDYYAYGSTYNLYEQNGQADWGYNAINNGGNSENSGWRTLKREEWQYIINTRETQSGIRFAIARVFGVNGVILLPDDWDSSYYSLNNTNNSSASFSSNVITAADWSTLEQHGAIFLPAAGCRNGISLTNAGSKGYYWTASQCFDDDAYNIGFYSGYLSAAWVFDRNWGLSVRLVRNVATHLYVDLGLPSGTLWATCNVGADSPEDYGDYFAWGETQPKDTYDWSTYQHSNGGTSWQNPNLTKYCSNSSYGYNGFTDNLTTLLPEDDVATVNWGAGWRTPTQEELNELFNNTTVAWTQQNGVNGRLFSAPNGNSLFLPAVGVRDGSSLNNAGSYGFYWSSSLYTDYPNLAWGFDFYSDYYGWDDNLRSFGFAVRPVRSSRQN